MIKFIRCVLFITGTISTLLLVFLIYKETFEYVTVDVYTEQLSKEVLTNNTDKIHKDELRTEATSVLEIDSVSLRKHNPDFVGWIHSSEMSLPIVKTTDNDYYLTHNFDNEESKYGSIFIDYRLDTADDVLMVYGHNTIGGVMFGSLKDYLSVENREDIYIALDSTYYDFKTYSIETCFIVNENDALLTDIPNNIEIYKGMLMEHLTKPSDKFINCDKIVILSTCHGKPGTDKRLIVVLVN